MGARVPTQKCPFCGEIIRVKPLDTTSQAWRRAMDYLVVCFERHVDHCEAYQERQEAHALRKDWYDA